jgi:hypothetical protein
VKPCQWQKGACTKAALPISGYCPEHAERARRNILRALGPEYAPGSFLWRESDAEWFHAAGTP